MGKRREAMEVSCSQRAWAEGGDGEQTIPVSPDMGSAWSSGHLSQGFLVQGSPLAAREPLLTSPAGQERASSA